MKAIKKARGPFVCIALLVSASVAQAGGPLDLCAPNVPFLWPDGGTNIPFNPDQGNLGILNGTEATAAVGEAFQAWQDVATSTVTYVDTGQMPVDVDQSNFFFFLFPGVEDGLSPIVFDDDGAIFELLFGPGSGVLGFAGSDVLDPVSCAITEGAAFLNGPAIDTLEGLLDLMVHEFGHYTNLAHTVVNGQIFIGDSTGPTPDNDTFGFPPFPDGVEVIETMYPFLFSGVDQLSRTPHKDDIAALSTLYPEPDFLATTGTIRGTISVRGHELSGVNVIARNLADPFVDAVSAISGDFTQGAPANGTYTLNGLTHGASYAVYVDAIQDGGFSTPPRLALPGPEEFHNTEGTESDSDDPLAFDGVIVAAGSPSTGVDIIFNPFQPDSPLPVGEDGAVEVFLPFQFRMCGQRFDSVFINANGNLTFGTPDFQFAENIPEFLGGPPRVAGLWRDLSPFNLVTGVPQGSVSFSETHHSFTAHWNGVPEFPDAGSNTFSITLYRIFGGIEIKSGDLTASNGLVGISCGAAVTSQFEQESNLSKFLKSRPCGKKTACLPIRKPAIFELFDNDDHDLAETRLLGSTIPFFDRYEHNDTLKKAASIRLPFNTIAEKRFTEIRPAGQDVDYFKARRLKEGQTLIAETLSGQLDSVLGIFDANGNLLAVDDDGGSGVLSRVELVIPADGTYFIAVGAWPDFEFTGDGNTDPTFGVGRYVLDVQAL
jgi:hypothetical protein